MESLVHELCPGEGKSLIDAGAVSNDSGPSPEGNRSCEMKIDFPPPLTDWWIFTTHFQRGALDGRHKIAAAEIFIDIKMMCL